MQGNGLKTSADQSDYSDTTLITPTLNEAHNIDLLLDTILNAYPGIRIIVSDDGSTDATKRIVLDYSRKYPVAFIDRTKESVHGLTASVIDAVRSTKTDYFVCIDADFQHPLEKISEFVEKLRKGADFVIGTREIVAAEWPTYRLLISLSARFLGRTRLLFRKSKDEDLTSGFFGARTSFVMHYLQYAKRFEPRGYKIMFDIIKQLPNNAQIERVYFLFEARRKGSSKMGMKHVLYFVSSLLR